MNVVRFSEFMSSGARNLLRHKLRSLLALLGVFFGVSAVITMLGIGEGAQRSVMREISGLGLNNVIAESVQPTQPQQTTSTSNRRRGLRQLEFGLNERDYAQLKSMFPEAELTRAHVVREKVYRQGRLVDAKVLGVAPDYFDYFETGVVAGRLLGAVDDFERRRVVVVSEGLTDLFQAEDTLARRPIQVGRYFFEVAGVIRQPAQGATPFVLMPYQTARSTFGTSTLRRDTGSMEYTRTDIGQIVLRFIDESVIPGVAGVLKQMMERNHPEGDVKLVVPLEILEAKQRTQRILNLVLITIAGISLLVGGIGIMNIMLAVVTERIPEIGIRRALGATRRDILYQFLAETITLSTVGGLLGCLCGFIVVPLASRFIGWEGVITPGAVMLSLAVSWLVGLVFGMAPALRAAKMDPVEALRHG